MKKHSKILTLVVLLICLSSCNRKPDGSISWAPYSMDLNPPPGPAEYRKGWSQGCESGKNAYSNPFYKMIGAYEYRFDAKLRNNKMYYQAWKDAYLYCAIFLERTNNLTP